MVSINTQKQPETKKCSTLLCNNLASPKGNKCDTCFANRTVNRSSEHSDNRPIHPKNNEKIRVCKSCKKTAAIKLDGTSLAPFNLMVCEKCADSLIDLIKLMPKDKLLPVKK